MRILVTGNMGYVGSAVVRRLHATLPGVELTGYDTGFFAHCLTTHDGLPELRLKQQVFGDVRDLPIEILESVDVVVQLAAISNDPMGNRFAAQTEEINFRAAIEIAKRARIVGVKGFVFASSCSVYGAAEGPPRKEEDSLSPHGSEIPAFRDGLRHVGSLATRPRAQRRRGKCSVERGNHCSERRLSVAAAYRCQRYGARSRVGCTSSSPNWWSASHCECRLERMELSGARTRGRGGSRDTRNSRLIKRESSTGQALVSGRLHKVPHTDAELPTAHESGRDGAGNP